MQEYIKHDNGWVTFAMRVGKNTFVKDVMKLYLAEQIVKDGKDIKVSDKRGYGTEICVGDTYFFPYDDTVEDTVDEPVADEVKEDE